MTTSLRARLLFLTILFVMIVEALIYLPSLATFRQNFLEERIANAQIAALALVAAPNNSVSVEIERSLLNSAGVIAIVLPINDQSLLLGFDLIPDPEGVNARYDIRTPSLGGLIMDAITTLNAGGNRIIQVVGQPTLEGARLIELTLDEQALFEAMADYSNNILLLSLIVSVFTGVLIYLALHWMVVRPLRRIKDRIIDFRERPERVQSSPRTARRSDEIGVIGRELARMQEEVRQSIQQKSRLAELGEAVSKINHDLRNILATAQLASDSLRRNDDPKVQKTAGRLISAVSRAVALCERTMKHGAAKEPEPEPQQIRLKPLVDDVRASLDDEDSSALRFDNLVDEAIEVYVDEAQIHRVLLNLCRNAIQAQTGEGLVEITAVAGDDNMTHIRVRDEGRGIPEQALPNLFKAFNTSSRAGGTGLGLAISREIVLAHGGQIGLEKTGKDGTVFLLCLPGKAA